MPIQNDFNNPKWGKKTSLSENEKIICENRLKGMFACLRARDQLPPWANEYGANGCGEVGVAIRASAFVAVRFWVEFLGFTPQHTGDGEADPNHYVKTPDLWTLKQKKKLKEDINYEDFQGLSKLDVCSVKQKALAFTCWWASKAFVHPTRLFYCSEVDGNKIADEQLKISVEVLLDELNERKCPQWDTHPKKQCNQRRCILY